MSDFQFREMIRLLRLYCLEVDQFDYFRVIEGGNDWFVDIGMKPIGEISPNKYRLIDETAQVEVKKILEVK